jgi:hypothetical protein
MTRGTQYVILVGVIVLVVFGTFIGIAVYAGVLSR